MIAFFKCLWFYNSCNVFTYNNVRNIWTIKVIYQKRVPPTSNTPPCFLHFYDNTSSVIVKGKACFWLLQHRRKTVLDKNNYIVAPKDSCFIIQSSGVNNTYNEDRCPKHVHRKLFISRQTSKKKNFFIKFDRRVKQIIGCQRATLILGALEYWFIKKRH